ncbi:aminomethyl transferase family protein [Roseinatronobacter alkalisoli]|uniref:Aminomethyl transferase family protein n=1 Tax=Roseinatronobacter alkalisoli TaxID=3028235 RepID=A0ABT5TD07_9RHOB|nr:aminomethyl transferase family protein [Roseinatronobacter sp. HJB301]MDD7972859.1 aminomethyl transferase family protein [Roseinatronobacter sp. HJB301]
MTTIDAPASLEALIRDAGGAVNFLRSSNLGPYVFPGIPPEFSNWRAEQRAWNEGVALLEQSYHMTELHLHGTEVIKFLSGIALNKLDPFQELRAKQIVLAGHDGNYIADAILFRESETFFRVVGAPFASDWLLFHAEQSEYDVKATKDDNWSVGQRPRHSFRFQIQGPHALELMREITGGTLPQINFFRMGDMTIAGKPVRALRHGMAGTPGFELYGAWEDQQAVRAAFDKLGRKYNMRKVGAMAYSTTAQHSGWLPMPIPAIYAGAEMKPYREWLNSYFLESVASLGGSFMSEKIEDYYVDPIEIGYGGLIDWDRDFIGAKALKAKQANQTRTKVTLEWDDEDVARVMGDAMFKRNGGAQFIAMPMPMYATFQADAVLRNGKSVGFSTWPGFTALNNKMISLGVVNLEDAQPGTKLTMLWGEPNSKRATVDSHSLREISVTVAPAPYFDKVIKSKQQ